VRPADDISRFFLFTGLLKRPLIGLHGELLLVRSSIEDTIGWDFGPNSLCEDAHFALLFAKRYPGKTSFLCACVYGASPERVKDFLKQRRRWAAGLIEIVLSGAIPFRDTYVMAYNVLAWATAPLQHLGTVLLIAALMGYHNTSPVSPVIVPMWAFTQATIFFTYLVGYRINQDVSRPGSQRPWHPLLVMAGLPLFSTLEGLGVTMGLYDAVTRRVLRQEAKEFAVITKTR
jgi:beta-1,4-mannosyltransferase